MPFEEKNWDEYRFNLAARRVLITTPDLTKMGLSFPSGIKVPAPFVILDESLDHKSYPRLENPHLKSGEEVVLTAENKLEERDVDGRFTALRLTLPQPYRYGDGDPSFGGTVDLDLAVETLVHSRSDLAARLPNLRSGHGKRGEGHMLFQIEDFVKAAGFPITLLSLNIKRYDVIGEENGQNCQEEIKLEWAFRESQLAGVSLETYITQPGKAGAQTRTSCLPDYKTCHFGKWGCGVYPVYEERACKRGVEQLNKWLYNQIITGIISKQPAEQLFLEGYNFESKEPCRDYMEKAMLVEVASILAPEAIKKVSFRKSN